MPATNEPHPARFWGCKTEACGIPRGLAALTVLAVEGWASNFLPALQPKRCESMAMGYRAHAICADLGGGSHKH